MDQFWRCRCEVSLLRRCAMRLGNASPLLSLTVVIALVGGCIEGPLSDVSGPDFAKGGEKGKPKEEPQFDYRAVVSDDVTQYQVTSDDGKPYVRRERCVGVGPISPGSTIFHVRTVRNTDECHAEMNWRFFQLHVGSTFDFDQDGTSEAVEQVPARFMIADVFTNGATSVEAGLDVFTVDDDGTTSSAFTWHITYANDANRVQVGDNTVDIILPPDHADVASLCEYVTRGKGKNGGRICEDRDPNGLKLPFEIRAIRIPVQ
jgi:hypothetical protein